MNRGPSSRRAALGWCGAVVLGLGDARAHEGHPPRPSTAAPLPPIPGLGGRFSLLDHHGRPRTQADWRGRLLLITFGFTECPHICQVELQAMGDALDLLGPALAAEVQPLFIAIDPRDTPPRMAAFVGRFHPAIIGLTGDAAQIGDVVRRFRVHVQLDAEDPARSSHSTFLYLMGREGGFLSLLLPGAAAADIATRVRRHAA